jgi:Dna[CI] antecedent, DciA
MRERDLQPIRVAGLEGREAAEARAQARLERAWHFVVGPFLAKHTRLLRLRKGTLVMGCWTPELVPNLRKSAEAVWPQVQERIQRQLRLKVLRLDIVPCDPPPAPAPRPEVVDPLEAVLRKLRSLHNPRWTSEPK